MSVRSMSEPTNPSLHRERVRSVLSRLVPAPDPCVEASFYRGLTPLDRSAALKWWALTTSRPVPDGLGSLVCDSCGHAHDDLSWRGEQQLVMCVGCWTGESSTCASKSYDHHARAFAVSEEGPKKKLIDTKKERSRPPRDREKDRSDILAGVAEFGNVTAYARAVGVKPVTMHNRAQGAGLRFYGQVTKKPNPSSPPPKHRVLTREEIISGAYEHKSVSAYARSMGVSPAGVAARAHQLGIRKDAYTDVLQAQAARALTEEKAKRLASRPTPARTDFVRTAVEITQALKSSVSAKPRQTHGVSHALLAVVGEGISTAAPVVFSGATFDDRGMLMGGRRYALSEEARASVEFDDRMREYELRYINRPYHGRRRPSAAAQAEGLE